MKSQSGKEWRYEPSLSKVLRYNSSLVCSFSYVVRIESMLLTEEFPAECEAMKRDIKTLRSATKGTKQHPPTPSVTAQFHTRCIYNRVITHSVMCLWAHLFLMKMFTNFLSLRLLGFVQS